MTQSTARRWWAVLGSFVVYVIPLVGPHAAWFVGEALVVSAAAGRPAAWVATDFALAITAQAATGAVLYWSLGGGWARKVAWLGIVPLAVSLNIAYLAAIPANFLVEPDSAPPLTTWAEHCIVRGAPLMSIRTGAIQPAVGAQAWWSQRSTGSYALIRVPECSVSDARLPTPTLLGGGRVDMLVGLVFARPDGAALVEQTQTTTSQQTWSVLTGPDAALIPLQQPDDIEGSPVLASRGDAVAWLQRVAGTGPPILKRVLIRRATPTSTLDEVDIELAPFGAASYSIIDLDAVTREVTLWRNDRPFVVDFNGQEQETLFEPGAIRAQGATYLRTPSGWVAWDAYRDDGPYSIAWSVGGRSGVHRTNAGRSVTAAAVDPTGRFIAVSETTTLSIGNAQDVVYVLRTDTGADVFRVYLPRYSRSQVVFFNGGLFGYSTLDATHVLKLPMP